MGRSTFSKLFGSLLGRPATAVGLQTEGQSTVYGLQTTVYGLQSTAVDGRQNAVDQESDGRQWTVDSNLAPVTVPARINHWNPSASSSILKGLRPDGLRAFGNFRSGIRRNRVVGKAILSFVLIITIGINYLTFVGRYEIVWGANKLAVGGISLPLPSVAPSPSSHSRSEKNLHSGSGGLDDGVSLASVGGPGDAPIIDPGVEQQINIIDQEYSTTSTSDTPATDELGVVCWNNNAASCDITTGQYTGATVYFEAVIKNSGGFTTTATLYAANGGAAVSGSAVTTTSGTYKRVRSGSLSLTNDADYTVKVKASSGTASIIAARIIVIQSTVSTFADTQTHIEVGNKETTTSTTMVSLTNPKYFQYDNSKYDGTKTAYFEATLLAGASTSSTTDTPNASGNCNEVDYASGTQTWANDGNAFQADNTYTTAQGLDGGAVSTSEYMKCNTYGFALPANASV